MEQSREFATSLYQLTIDCSGSSCSAPVISTPLTFPSGTIVTTISISLTPDDLLLYANAALAEYPAIV